MKKVAILTISILTLFAFAKSAQADIGENLEVGGIAKVSANDCKQEIHNALAKEQRTYRSTLFGEPNATGATIGHVRFAYGCGSNLDSEEGLKVHPWIKVGKNKWKNVSDEETGDACIENNAEISSRRGIFDTQKTLTSELIPYLIQSVRAVQCKTMTICERVERSINAGEDAPETIESMQPMGCIKEEDQSYFESCRFAKGSGSLPDDAEVRTYCPRITKEMLQRESDLLRLAVEYDAAYRSLLQFAGNFDLSLKEFRWPFVATLRHAAGIIGQLSRIPCFLASCDASPTEP